MLLFNKTGDNVSHYLIGNVYDITDNGGNFEFQINSIDISAPHGEYFVRVDFNGSLNLQNIPGINPITNFMVHSNSSLVPLNITAGTILTQEGYTSELEFIDPTIWMIGDVLHVFGNLTWDNSIPMQFMKVRVTVQYLNGTIIAANNSVQTDFAGRFEGLLIVDPTWPTQRDGTMIVVYFEPTDNFLDHVEKSNIIYV